MLCIVVAIPMHLEENAEKISPVEQAEMTDGEQLEPDWQLVPDGDGYMHLVNLNEIQPDSMFNAWNDVFIRVVTRSNWNDPRHIALNNVAHLRASPFNRLHPTRVIIHGWLNDANSRINHLIPNAYLERGNFNILVVDWSRGAINPYYPTARNHIFDVGHYVAQFLDFLRREDNFNMDSLIVIGHSLGAHTAGIVGKRSGVRLPVIFGIDPSMPLFSIFLPQQRLDASDAHYVEAMHTDIGRLGFNEPLGDVTFYPNFGIQMPGCGIDATGTCGHNLAVDFLAESLLAVNRFWGTRCASFSSILLRFCPPAGASQLMGGEPMNRVPNGVYFFPTNAAFPRAQGFRN